MISQLTRKLSLDRMAIGLSALCILHCVATLLLIGSMMSMGATLANPIVHEIGLALATGLAALALGSGYFEKRDLRPLCIGAAGLIFMASSLFLPHGFSEFFASFAGLALVAWAHFQNLRAVAR